MNEAKLQTGQLGKILQDSVDSYPFFLDHIFSQSADILKDGVWTGGVYPSRVAQRLQDNKMTIRVSARDHMKSMSFYGHIMWKIYRMHFMTRGREINYFSYNYTMAAYHCAKIKTAVACNPFFADVIDNKEQAESILSYQWDSDGPKITITPRGLMEFKRGIHCDDVYVDDPFQDPENKLVPTKITKINDVMKKQIMDMYQQELHVVGTAQTKSDFFFDPEFTHRFHVAVEPAVVDDEKKISLWPEWMPYEELMAKKRERGEKVFNQEYLCSPVYSEESYVTEDTYDRCVNHSLKNWTIEEWEKQEHEDRDRVGGYDIGKKTHPSHFAVFEYNADAKKWQQIHSKWLDNWDYNDQREYLERACNAFDLYELRYDATRGEFEAFEERNELPAEMTPVVFTHRRKHAMAGDLDKAVSNGDVEFLDDRRQRSQILTVNNDLQAPETPEGHGDSFWSVCLALADYEGADVEATLV